MPGRSAEQLSRTPGQWHDHQAQERRRTLAALLAELRGARERGEEWYRWIADGCRPLTEAEYAALPASGTARGRRGSRRSSS